jgi:glycosyltransferase involved in cell wall biosynthesis
MKNRVADLTIAQWQPFVDTALDVSDRAFLLSVVEQLFEGRFRRSLREIVELPLPLSQVWQQVINHPHVRALPVPQFLRAIIEVAESLPPASRESIVEEAQRRFGSGESVGGPAEPVSSTGKATSSSRPEDVSSFESTIHVDLRWPPWGARADPVRSSGPGDLAEALGPHLPVATTPAQAPTGDDSVLHVLVLVDIWGRQGGGIPVFNEQFCRALSGCSFRGRKVHVTCVCLRGLAAGVGQQSAGDTLEILQAKPRLGVTDESRLALVDAPFLSSAVCRSPVSLVIGHDRFSGAAAITVGQTLGCQSAYFVHTNPLQIGVEKGADYHGHDKHEAMLAEMRQANIIVFVGNTIYEFDHLLPSSAARVHFNPGWFMAPADVDREWPPGWWAESTATPRSVSVAGRVYDESVKGISRAVEITKALVRSNVNARIVLIGGTEDDMRTLRHAFESAMHPPSYVMYSDDVSVIYRFYLNSVCVLCPSRVDSFGLVAAEAFGAGVPVLVSTRTGVGQYLVQLRERAAQDPAFLSIRHAVLDTIDLMVVDGSDDADDLANTWIPRLRRILNDPQLIRFGLHALKSVWPSWEASVQALCNEGLFARLPAEAL